MIFQLLSEKSVLEESLRSATLQNVSLSGEIQRLEVEMQSVQSRLLSALGDLDRCKERQTSDEERITALNAKCAKMEER